MDLNRVWRQEVTADALRIPLLATAIHDGHLLRDDLEPHIALDSSQRLREEDPFTGGWTSVAPTRIVGLASRFQVDLNRPRERAVYLTPDDAWGLRVWKDELPNQLHEFALAEYDEFYATMHAVLHAMTERFGRFVVYDLHSYNHRRTGPDADPAPEDENPQVNVGTGSLDRDRWAPVVDRFMDDLGRFDFPGGGLDVRENVKFRGGHFAQWVHAGFPDSACVLAVEFKKFFMDEWTGRPDDAVVAAIGSSLESTVSGVVAALQSVAP